MKDDLSSGPTANCLNLDLITPEHPMLQVFHIWQGTFENELGQCQKVEVEAELPVFALKCVHAVLVKTLRTGLLSGPGPFCSLSAAQFLAALCFTK